MKCAANKMPGERKKELHDDVNKLLELKMSFPEIKEIPKINAINDYIESSMTEIKITVKSMEETNRPDWQELNELFLREL